MSAARRLPALLVTGFKGVGKTTLINGWLARRPPGERWAVLAVDSGALRLDRAAIGPGEVHEIAGGCACCAASVAFRATLARILRRGPWDRLIVEAGALGHPAAVFDLLREPGLAEAIDPLPAVVVLDARRPAPFHDPGHPAHESALAAAALARLAIVNRAAELGGDELAARLAAVAALPPWPRPAVATVDGTLPLSRVAALAGADALPAPLDEPATTGLDAAPHAVAAPDASGWSCRWRWRPGRVFDRERALHALRALPATPAWQARGLLRVMAVFRTERAWHAWQWEDGRERLADTGWRLDSRLEVVAMRAPDPQMTGKAPAGFD